jgi:hypothetical protein
MNPFAAQAGQVGKIPVVGGVSRMCTLSKEFRSVTHLYDEESA